MRQNSNRHRLFAQHSALNITLFPPLFFFATLYYTDVASTLSVLIVYWFCLYCNQKSTSQLVRQSVLILLGLISLMFRQTNIFWIAIFPAGVAFVSDLDRGHQVIKDSMHRRAEGFGDSWMSVAKTSWKMQVVFDPPVADAWIGGNARSLVVGIYC